MFTQDPQASVRKQAALRELFSDLFDADGLRRWATENLPRGLVEELPHKIASKADLLDRLTELLGYHGLVDSTTASLLQLREQRRLAGRRSSQSGFARTDGEWQRRYKLSLAITLALLATFALTRGYPRLDVSVALLRLESGLFGFLPISYQRSGVIGLALLAAICTVLFRYAARDAKPRP